MIAVFFATVESLVLLYFLYVVLYTLVFSLAATLWRRRKLPAAQRFHRMLVLIPAYREDAVIVDSAREALKQDYPAGQYEVLIIADSLHENTLKALRTIPVNLIEVSFSESTKVKALNRAFAHTGAGYDVAVILDADNHMAPDFLSEINRAYEAGYLVMQGRRTAKNRNTHLAVLDGLSELLNNHIYRAGSFAMGLSAALSGSGMAFPFSLLKKTLAGMDAVGGFDRELEVLLLRQGHRTAYVPNAVVYDKKTEKTGDFARQRRRWIASQYIYLKKYFGLGTQSLLAGNMALFHSAVLRNIQLPRVINLGLLAIIACMSLLLSPVLFFSSAIWWILLGLLVVSLALAVPITFYDRAFWRSLIALPHTFGLMLLLLLRLRGANRRFLHTRHDHTDQDSTN